MNDAVVPTGRPVSGGALSMWAMPDLEPPRLNKHGLEIWFKAAKEDGGFAPVHRKGWIAFILAIGWTLFSSGVGVVMVLLWAFAGLHLWIALSVPFVFVAPGLFLLGNIVRRHS